MMIIILLCVFVALMLLIGGDRGAISLISLTGNIGVFFLMLILMSWNMNPIVISAAACIIINGITLLYQNGRNEKTVAALAAVVATMLLLFGVAAFWGYNSHIAGLNEIEIRSELSLYYNFDIGISMRLVMISMLLIGMIGAVMDMAIAITSAVYEVYQQNSQLTGKELFQSGITIGKDVLGTTLNTLFFAYIGENMILLLYLIKYQYAVMDILNSKALLQELICILSSGLGCLICIPISALLASALYTHHMDAS